MTEHISGLILASELYVRIKALHYKLLRALLHAK